MKRYILSLDSKYGIEVCDVQADSIDGVLSIMQHALNHICNFIPVNICYDIKWRKLIDDGDEALLLGKFRGGNIYAKVKEYTGIPEGRPGASISYKPY